MVEHKHYLYGGKSLVATYTERNNGTPAETRYVHTDHLDSVSVITDDNGGVVERLSFDPFGKRRQVNGQDAVSPITSSINRGFTRHEQDDEVGLINMNARLYDPLLGRFIAPDSVIEGPVGQGLNRYSYVRNNPLSLVDPSGHKSLRRIVRVVVAAVVAYYTAGLVSGWLASSAATAGSATAFASVTTVSTAAGVTTTATLTGLGQVVAGMAAGGVSGWAGSGNSKGAMYGAVSGGFGSYLSNGTNFANPIERASSFGSYVANGNYVAAGSMLGNTAMNYGFQRVEASIARHYGVSPEAFNIGLMGLSMVGNSIDAVGTRFGAEDDGFSRTGGVGFRGFGNRGVAGYFFDAVDTMLGYQGLPTASTRDYLVSGYAGRPVTGHSLGALDASYTIVNGLSSGGVAYSLPFGNVAPSGLAVNLGTMDAVNGGYVGRIFNPGATMCANGVGSHSLNSYLSAGC